MTQGAGASGDEGQTMDETGPNVDDEGRKVEEPAARAGADASVNREGRSGTGEVARPPRPELYVGKPPPRLTPPEPPASQRLAAAAWKASAAAMGLSVGLLFLDLSGRREHLTPLVEERGAAVDDSVLRQTTDIVFWGGVGAWAVVALAALFVAAGMKKPRGAPRFWGVLLAVVTVAVVLLTVVLLVPGSGPLGWGARIVLGAGAAFAALGALLGLDPRVWRWIKDHRND